MRSDFITTEASEWIDDRKWRHGLYWLPRGRQLIERRWTEDSNVHCEFDPRSSTGNVSWKWHSNKHCLDSRPCWNCGKRDSGWWSPYRNYTRPGRYHHTSVNDRCEITNREIYRRRMATAKESLHEGMSLLRTGTNYIQKSKILLLEPEKRNHTNPSSTRQVLVELNDYLKVIGRHADGNCVRCKKPETIEHFIMECVLNSDLISEIKNSCMNQKIPMNITTILKNNETMEKITDYIIKNGRKI